MGNRVFDKFFVIVLLGACCALVVGCEAAADDGNLGTGSASSSSTDGTESRINGDCTPSCAFKECGDDTCGGSCGSCAGGDICHSFQCVYDDGILEDESVTVDEGNGSGSDDSVVEDTTDDDNDQVPASEDNCPTVYNPDQADLDGDWLGDACDPDRDEDGYLNELDCAPDDNLIHPGAAELCSNAVDDDCDAETDEEGASDCTDYFIDADGDGAGYAESIRCLCDSDGDHTSKISGDCDDTDPAYSPLVTETCDDLDNNCNGLLDEGCDDDGDGYCDWDLAMGLGPPPSVCPKGGGDCYDYSDLVNPEMTEIDGNGIDDNCDGKMEGEPGVSVIEPNCSGLPPLGNSVENALTAMEICYGSQLWDATIFSPTTDILTGAWGAIDHYGDPSNDLAPFAGPSYFAMATGSLTAPAQFGFGGGLVEGPGTLCPAPWGDYADGACSDPFSSDGYEFYDAVEFAVNLQAPPGATGFSVDYIFMSQEYEEFIGTNFNDKFYIILDAPQTTGGEPMVVNFTECSDPNQYNDYIDAQGNKWCFIAINTAFSEPCSSPATNISGSGFECGAGGSSTGWLTTAWPIQSGEGFTLRFHIHDSSDEYYDSAVLIDNFRFEGGSFESGTVTHN